MKNKVATTICIGVFVFLLVSLGTANAADGEKPTSSDDVDEIIQGFEDHKEKKDIENLMEGFEDGPPPEVKSSEQVEDELLQGFESETGEDEEGAQAEDKSSTWRLDGEFTSTATYNFNPDAESPWRGVTMLRQELELTLKKHFSDNWQGQVSGRGFYDLIYVLRGRDEYTQQVLDEYEKELELEDTYIQGSILNNLDTKIGRQIVVWGTLDNLRVVDVLNPLDLRVPGLTDIDDLRLPVTMLKLDYYFGNWNLSGMAIPEVRFSKLPVFGSDFYPLPNLLPPEEVPDDGFENAEYAAAFTGVFSGWDIGFYFADFYDDQTYVETVFAGQASEVIRKHARITMLGTAANLALGNWLLKGEAAWLDGLKYSNTPGVEYSRLDLGGGLEYSGFSEATISIEAVNRHIFDYNKQLEMPPDLIRKDEFQWNFRFMKDFLNDTLTLTLFASTFGIKADDGAFERIDAEYDISDAVSIRGGVVFYQSGDKGIFQNVAANDRLFVVFKYSF